MSSRGELRDLDARAVLGGIPQDVGVAAPGAGRAAAAPSGTERATSGFGSYSPRTRRLAAASVSDRQEVLMFRLEMLPAGHGDCLWIEYGQPRNTRRVLIDGGTAGTYGRTLRDRLRRLPVKERRFELLVITHIDADHIAGVLELLADAETGFQANDIWFNGYRHLPSEAPETLGPVQGERLTDLLVKPGVTWNGGFRKAAVVVPSDGELPRVELDGGLALTLLSPTPAKLADLKPAWEKEVRRAGLDPNQPRPGETEAEAGLELLGAPDVEALAAEPFSEDSAEANGSSIALLAEFDGRRVLLTGDAHPGVLTSSIRRIAGRGRLAVDACKLPHHGSKANVSRQLVQALDCRKWLFSSNGAYFRHPDRQAVARVIKWGGPRTELSFNYRSRFNEVWDGKPLQEQFGYEASYPAASAAGTTIEWK
jgi:beta-lactamase superfamily II metal-dependent hydrolase